MTIEAGSSAPGAQVRIPALDQASAYVSRLSARSGLYSDLRLLIDGLDEPLPSGGYRSLVLEGNRLSRSSASARRKLWKELRSRYILDASHALFAAFWSEWMRCDSESERGLTTYTLLALNDRLIADLGTEWLFGLLRRAPSEIRVDDVSGFIRRSVDTRPEVVKWSDETIKSVARHYMASIRDFGLAQGKTRKLTIRPALYAAPVRLLIRALRLSGTRDQDLIHSNIFRLVALNGMEIIDALSELNRQGVLRFKMQADVMELNLEAANEKTI